MNTISILRTAIRIIFERNNDAASLRGQVNPSRYRSIVDQEVCAGCCLCVDECPMKNITLNAANQVEAGNACLGCGICTHVCREEALYLKLIHEADHIPE